MKLTFKQAAKIAKSSKNRMKTVVAILLILFIIAGVIGKVPLSEILFVIGGFTIVFFFDKLGDWARKSKVGG